ncbi:MAG: alpha/beta hydrolase [Myxococcaceae bacterium]|nr:alpha/beta hydrolase [Myxococcaceae bacterium]
MRSLLVCFVVVGCIAPQPVLLPPQGDEVTVFLHGYRASFLATESGELAYVTPGQGLSKGDRSLAFSFAGQREFAKYGPLHVVGPLTRLTAIPFFLDLDPYASWMDWAKTALPGFQVYAYDWRADIRESGRGLCERLEALGPSRRVRLIGHSMGGLVALSCLRSGHAGAKTVVKVAFVGTPFQGGPGQWDDLQLGTPTSSNTALLSAEALLTFPSTWQLLSPTPDFFVDASGSPVTLAAYDAQTWLDRRWGLFAEPSVRENPAYRAQLEARFIAHAELWGQLGDVEGEPPTWSALAVIGTGRSTVVGWRAAPGGDVDLTTPVRGDGDGTVPTTRARPPKPISFEAVDTRAEHSALLNDDGVREVLRQFVR